jgi:hypothetical protein
VKKTKFLDARGWKGISVGRDRGRDVDVTGVRRVAGWAPAEGLCRCACPA